MPGGNGPCDPRGRRPADGSGDELEKGKKNSGLEGVQSQV